MFSILHFQGDAARPRVLNEFGLAPAALLGDPPPGIVIKRKRDLTVHRVAGSDGTWLYLKRCGPPSLRRGLSLLRQGKCVRSESYDQSLAARALSDAGFSVMSIVAAGEWRLLGVWPVRGFLLAAEVPGDELSASLARAEPHEAAQLWRAVGRLLARLHAAGFSHAIRMHDLFHVKTSVHFDGVPDLTMIDCDFKGAPPEPQQFSINSTIQSLAQCAYLFLRCGNRLTRAHLRVLFREYRSTLCSLRAARCRLARAVSEATRARFDQHHERSSTNSQFPAAPTAHQVRTSTLARLLAPGASSALNPRPSAAPLAAQSAAPEGELSPNGARHAEPSRGCRSAAAHRPSQPPVKEPATSTLP